MTSSFVLGGEHTVHRLAFGAMQITGAGVWGPPDDHDEAVRVLRRAVDLGVNLIDTADSYGPGVSEELIAEALHPYPDGLVIATKGGFTRPAPGRWVMNGHDLRRKVEDSLRRLRLERIDLYQLHRVDPTRPAEDQFGELADLRQEGKIGQVGLSEVDVEMIERAREIVPIVSVQNMYNLVERGWEPVVDHCEKHGIGFFPWFPIATGNLARPGGPLEEIARNHEATPVQLALAWLLRRSPVMLPIPGTSKVAHLEENMGAEAVRLTDEEYTAMAALAG
ncbi:oxidoreductase [Longispora fulva]|uniref:Aryl-alcohol dehydrogenase-like predicted oxidoreductase n=1 Tax=Longispora fulva TaxID=619741 RepID=A0A8J7GJK0_9ACTN|nr:aldo/keto reductase [Longispora fulva]MBG6137962.1 aryl-alcohol dehydrogenase-like predicted oxidoreductase [Longispora fulva]GIG60215.1 oxidoreductase [Longispora fulva]